jgi:hypothetical protein
MAIIFSLYFIILLTFVLLYFFIVYHLIKYSINASLNKILLPVFIVVSTLLLFSNIILFFSIDWKQLISKFI